MKRIATLMIQYSHQCQVALKDGTVIRTLTVVPYLYMYYVYHNKMFKEVGMAVPKRKRCVNKGRDD